MTELPTLQVYPFPLSMLAFYFLLPGMDVDVRLGLQDQLVDLIMRVLVNHDELHYYQVRIVSFLHFHEMLIVTGYKFSTIVLYNALV